MLIVSLIFATVSENDNPSRNYPAGNYMFKVNNRNTSTRCEICSKLFLVRIEYVIAGWVYSFLKPLWNVHSHVINILNYGLMKVNWYIQDRETTVCLLLVKAKRNFMPILM